VLLLARGHVVRDDVDDDVEARLAERTETRLAAEVFRDAPRVDDVVAVRRAATRLQDRREVEVADAELAQVRNELTRRGEAALRRQLQPVGRDHSLRYTQRARDSSVTSSRADRRSYSSRSEVVSSSCQRMPNRRGGSVKTASSWWALKRIRNESSSTRSPCGV